MPDRPTSTPGFYKSRLHPKGPWVPIEVWLDDGIRDEAGDFLSDQILRGLLGEIPFDPFGPLAEGRTMDFRDFARVIDKAEYDRLIDRLRKATTGPESRPHEPIDITTEPPIF